MKVLLSLVILFSSIGVLAQIKPTILTEIGTTNFSNLSYSAMIGFTNFQEDSFHAGVLYKSYGQKSRTGFRFNVNLNLSDELFLFIQSDVFTKTASQNNASFMENSAGLGLRIIKGLSLSAGYQMEDYNPVSEIRSEDGFLGKLGYKFSL